MIYNKSIDDKWNKIWENTKLNKFNPNSTKPKFYALEMFSYPSAAKLHLGHWFNYGPADTYARFKKLQGYNVFHPMGFDAFGLPAENYAIKTGTHPKDSTYKNIETMKVQLREMGTNIDWDYGFATCSEDYYKWTEWLFTELYKSGLAYKKYAPVNFCPSCQTVLANEQVIQGECERCHNKVERKKLSQWFYKTTAYAEELLSDLEDMNWPEATKKIQKNWIGKSTGANIDFKVCNKDITLTVFTTRADTLFGVTYVVIAPESELVKQLTTTSQQQEVDSYVEKTLNSNDIERMTMDRPKTGVFTGSYAINPANGKQVPIFIADYVLEGYGSGCVMAVPAHDERDYVFAKNYNLEIIEVVKGESSTLPFCDDGVLVNSNEFSGLTSEDARVQIIQKLNKQNHAQFTINYKLKDWLVSRQRYWGSPIPIVYCDDCGEVLVETKDLPVKLPYNVEFKPDGESPLKKCKDFVNCKCPKCNKPAKRETDTLDTFVCSSWYFLRHADPNNSQQPFDSQKVNKLLPVDVYVGGQEHASMHLLYARFITKFLRDRGYINFGESFKRLIHQGMILGPDGNKMSKSNGNVVAPDQYVNVHGADVFRMYLMYGFAFTQGGAWSDEGIKAIVKFFDRVCVFIEKYKAANFNYTEETTKNEIDLLRQINNSNKKIVTDTEEFGFNTAVSALMVMLNSLNDYIRKDKINKRVLDEAVEQFVIMFSPFAPFFAEEMWSQIGKEYSVHNQNWPTYTHYETETVEVVVQINGKVKCVLDVEKNLTADKIKQLALNNSNFAEQVKGKVIVKEIYIANKIFNVVIK